MDRDELLAMIANFYSIVHEQAPVYMRNRLFREAVMKVGSQILDTGVTRSEVEKSVRVTWDKHGFIPRN